jgi:hypothetical protein
MQNRRQIFALSSLILAILLVLIFVKLRNKQGSEIALRDISLVDRIVLADPYHSSELLKVDNSWFLFGTEPVDPVAADKLLIAASRLEIASILGNEGHASSDSLPGDMRIVTFFRGEKVLLSYGLKSVTGRLLLIPPHSESSFFVTVPGYAGLDLSRVFSTSPDHYRDHLLMDLRPSEISVVEIDLASGEAFRFSQDREGNIQCEAGNQHTVLPQGEPNALSMQLFFSYFTSFRFEQGSGIPADSLRGSARDELNLATIGLESFSGESHFLQVFSYHETAGSEPHLFRALVLHNDEQEAIFVNYIYLDVLMRGLSHYFGEK